MSTPAGACRAAVRWRRLAFKGIVFVFSVAVGFPLLASHGPTRTASATSSFNFNWTGAPASPQAWVPGQTNDWDLISNIDGPTDANGSMDAGHGADCSPPPATHHVVSLADSAFICKNHMMTAINGGGDAYATYGGVYFAPAQQVDWSQGPSSVSWNVSTERLSSRDWWQVNLTPFGENMVLPLNPEYPAYQGEPASGLEVRADNGSCNLGRTGTILRIFRASIGGMSDITQGAAPCVEDMVNPSATIRTRFQIDVSADHLKVSMPGTSAVWYDGPANVPFSRAVLQFSHHSYNPLKGGSLVGGLTGPNTYHWSDINISSASPFTMLRPQQPFSLHNGQNPALTLPQPAPGNAFLRFAGLGNFEVSFDGGRTYQPARLQGGNKSPEHFSSFWTPVPSGTTQIGVRGQNNTFNQPWWVQDVSVWAEGGGSSSPPPPPTSTPPVIQGPTPTPAASVPPTGTPAPITKPTPTPTVSLPPTPTPAPITNPNRKSRAINFRSASTATNSNWVGKPARMSKGDVLLAALEVDADPVKVTPPAGWTLLNDTKAAPGTPMAFHGQLYYKVAGAGEPSTYHFDTPPGVWTDIQVLAYSGVDTTRPIDAAVGRDAGITASPSSPSLKTTSNNDRLVLLFINYEYGHWTAPQGMVQRTDFDSNTASDRVLGAAGPVGAIAAQTTTNGAVTALAAALRPA